MYGGIEVIQGVAGKKLEGKSPLLRPSHRWEDNIKFYLQEIGERSGLG